MSTEHPKRVVDVHLSLHSRYADQARVESIADLFLSALEKQEGELRFLPADSRIEWVTVILPEAGQKSLKGVPTLVVGAKEDRQEQAGAEEAEKTLGELLAIYAVLSGAELRPPDRDGNEVFLGDKPLDGDIHERRMVLEELLVSQYPEAGLEIHGS